MLRDGVPDSRGVVDTVGDTVVGREERLNSREKEHRAVGSSATVESMLDVAPNIERGKDIRLGALAARNRNGVV